MPTYQVKDWDKLFENNKSRTRDRCSFVCVPNKQDGMGLTRLLNEPDGASIYGIWQLILGACSRQRRPRDGWLTVDGHHEGTAWTPDDLSLRWRRTSDEIQRALDVLSSPAVGWIIVHGECPVSAPEVSGECPSGDLEGKGKEGNGTPPTTPRARQPFEPDSETSDANPLQTVAPSDHASLLETIATRPALRNLDLLALTTSLERDIPKRGWLDVLAEVEDGLLGGAVKNPKAWVPWKIRSARTRYADDAKDLSNTNEVTVEVEASVYTAEAMKEQEEDYKEKGLRIKWIGEPKTDMEDTDEST